ncbi:MAG TPA: hypothetical protein VGM30_05105 [Puia sp.]|jgi:BASS family bile acid:Na+ symporter
MVTLAAGRNYFFNVGGMLIIAMFLHMSIGVLLGYWGGRLFRLSPNDCRTVAIEVGMQNSGLASGIAAQMGKIATVGLAPAINGPIMNTFFSLIGTWWGNRPVKKFTTHPSQSPTNHHCHAPWQSSDPSRRQ